MIEKPTLSDQSIIDCLTTHYGINVATLTFLPIGADAQAAVYKAQTVNSSYFVKLKQNHSEIGITIQALLHDTGIQQIIAPIKTCDGQLTASINDCTIIVYPFIDGHDGFSCTLTSDQWITLGKAMRHIHDFDVPLLIKDHIQREKYSPQWRDAVRALYANNNRELLHDESALQLSRFMQEQRNTIQHLVDRADQLAHQLQKESSPLVLCHSDIHAGNVLIAHNGMLYIVDWDQPIMAPKERDLMFIGGGVGNVWNKPDEEALFYKGYGETTINREILAYYRHERIVEDIAVYAQTLLLTNSGGNDRPVMYKHFIAMFEPHGVVDKAFACDKNL